MSRRKLKRKFYVWIRYMEKIPRGSRVTPAGLDIVNRYLWEQFRVSQLPSMKATLIYDERTRTWIPTR